MLFAARSKLAARSREPAFYRIKTTEFKENTGAKLPAVTQMQNFVLTEVDAQQSSLKKSTSKIVSSGNKSELSSLCIDGLSNSRGNIPKAMSSQDVALSSVRNSHRANHVHPVGTPPRAQGTISDHQVLLVPPTPGSFLLQQTAQTLSSTSNTAIANIPVEAVSDIHSVPSCSNQIRSNRAQDHSGNVPSTSFTTHHQNVVSASDYPPTPGTFLMPQENLNQTTIHSRPQNADVSNKMLITQPEAFSVKTPNPVTSTTAPVTMVTTIDHQNPNVETLESASVAMETTTGQPSQVFSDSPRLSISKAPDYENVQMSLPAQKSLEQTCRSSFVESGYRCEVVDEGHSVGLVSEHQEQDDVLNHNRLNEGAAEATDFKSEQIRDKVISFSDLASPQKRDFGVGDACVAELHLRSPRRKW